MINEEKEKTDPNPDQAKPPKATAMVRHRMNWEGPLEWAAANRNTV